MTTVAARYNVSSSYLARVCQQLGIPRPTRGFWAKDAAGIPVKRSVLPAAGPGQELDWAREGEKPRRAPDKRPPLHSLLVGARAHFDDARPAGYRISEYIRPYKSSLVDIYVSKGRLFNALEFANCLFLKLEERGHRVALASRCERYYHKRCEYRQGFRPRKESDYERSGEWKPGVPTLVFVDSVVLGITLFEISENVEVEHDSDLGKYVRVTPRELASEAPNGASGASNFVLTNWMPSGRLGIHVYAPKDGEDWERYWYENSVGEFSKRIGATVAELRQSVSSLLEFRQVAEAEEAEQRRKAAIEQLEWERKQADRRRVEAEAARVRDICQKIEEWRLARDIRQYIAELRQMMSDASVETVEGSAFAESILWALSYAEAVDPLARLREDIRKAILERDSPVCEEKP